MNRRFATGVALVLIALVVGAAIGTTAYRAGVVRGLSDAGRLPTPDPGTAVAPPLAYYGPFWYHGPWVFGPMGFLGPLLFFGLIFLLVRGLFWGRRCGGHGPGSGDVPPRFEEWHRRAHESTPKTSQSA